LYKRNKEKAVIVKVT